MRDLFIKHLTILKTTCMDVCIDVGNTRAKIALYKNNHRQELIFRDSADAKWLSKFIEQEKVERLIMSSTRIFTPEQQAVLDSNEAFYILTADINLPITIKYKTPKTLGKDRIAAAAGAKALFPKNNCLVIDAGTCITSDIVTEKGHYLGGAISPGIKMRLKAMHHFTAALPLVEMRDFNTVLGRDTEESLLAGSVGAVFKEIDGFIDHYKNEYPDLKVLMAGGDAELFDKNLKNEIFAVPNLVLSGLHNILKFNASK